MQLPTIVVPRFDLILPISGKKITARPFLSGEQKIILQATTLGDKNQLNNAIDDVLLACTFGKVDLDSLDFADIEWLILQIRAKSVDNVVKLLFTCNHPTDEGKPCGHKIPHEIQLDKVNLSEDIREPKIMLAENVGIMMKNISYGDYKKTVEYGNSPDPTITDSDIDELMMMASVESIFDQDELHSRADIPDEDLKQFLNGVYASDFASIEEYVVNAPTLSYTADLKCTKCGADDTVQFKGLEDFLV
jgi:hypothetical protein